MNRLNPNTLTGPRSYFTAFDHRIINRLQNHDEIRQRIERKLKLLLLVKSNIVCAASHLTTDFALSFFKDNPGLLQSGAIIPALRIDKEGIADLFDKQNSSKKKELIHFYNDNIRHVVSWELKENSQWFRDIYVTEFENPNSPLRQGISGVSESDVSEIVSTIKEQDVLSRQLIEDVSASLTQSQAQTMLIYRELLYHISGARVVNCESCLPQENYIEYDFADQSQQRTKLSDDQILWKLLIELAHESLQRRMIPVELLDLLSFEDILKIRIPLLEVGFQEKYDEFTSVKLPDHVTPNAEKLLNLHELENIRKKLEASFKSVFEEEMPRFLMRKATEDMKKAGSIASSVALGLAGMIPGIGTLFSLASVLKETPALYMNLAELDFSKDSIKSLDHYIERRNKVIIELAEKTIISDKSSFLEMADFLSSMIAERIRM